MPESIGGDVTLKFKALNIARWQTNSLLDNLVPLKNSSMSSADLARYVLAALAGLLLSAGFAPLEIAGSAWAGPGLVLFCSLGERGARAFRLGFVAGFVHFLSSIYWLLAIPFAWHGIPLAPALGWIALSAYCGLFFGLWVWFCWKIFPGRVGEPEFFLATAVDQFLSVAWWKRAQWAVLCAVAWIALEMARGRLLGGFPWNFLGASQYTLLPLIQIASITGVYGVSFIIVWFSVAMGGVLLILARRPSSAAIWCQAALPLLSISCIAAYGMTKTLKIPAPSREIRVALVQPSIPQTLIWDIKENANRFQQVLALSEKALASKPDLLIWPEASVPDLGPENEQAIAQLLASHQAWLIFSGDWAELLPSGETNYFNSSFLISPGGAIEAIYHKRRLVIFGEYIPLIRWLPFLQWLTPISGGFTPGERVVPFNITNLAAKTSVLICFEDMFPQEARDHVEADTDFLINLTNDGWFGDGAAQRQQAAGALFRAIENGVPLLRCANNGLTCWIDAQGRIREIEHEGGSIYGPGFITPTIPLRGPGERVRTIYNRYGDWFGWSCCALSGIFLLNAFWRPTMGGMRKFAMLVVFLAVAVLPAQAQPNGVTAELQLDQDQYLPDEDLPLEVRIVNRSGQTVVLGMDDQWITFQIMGERDYVVSKLKDMPVKGPFTLLSGQAVTREFNPTPYFGFRRAGRYSLGAIIKIAQWKQAVACKPVGFTVSEGLPLPNFDNLTFGVPPPPGVTNVAPEVRRYDLLKVSYPDQMKLYFRLTDNGGRTLRVFPLARMTSFGEPEAQLDRANNLHVLFQTGARTFTYCVMDPNGTLVARQYHEYTRTRPSLQISDDGRIFVGGGRRLLTLNDLPAPETGTAKNP
jgi:apolipoprotein N-acyltransferase